MLVKVNGRYQNQRMSGIMNRGFNASNGSNQRSKSMHTNQMGPPSNIISHKQSKYPDLSVLKPLLTMNTIQQYPKLSLMIYEALKPYI